MLLPVENVLLLINLLSEPLRELTPFFLEDLRVERLLLISDILRLFLTNILMMPSNHMSDPREGNSRRPEEEDVPMDSRYKLVVRLFDDFFVGVVGLLGLLF